MVTLRIDFIFCWAFDKTIHFGMNPIKGGIPANESNKIIMRIFIFF